MATAVAQKTDGRVHSSHPTYCGTVPAVSCSGDQEKNEGEWEENKTQGKNSVRNRWDRRQHCAADLPIYPIAYGRTPASGGTPNPVQPDPHAACAINEPFPPQLYANDATNMFTVICTVAQLRLRLQWFASGSTSISPESPFHRSTRRYLPSTDGRYLIPDIWHKVPGTKKAYGTETNIIAPKVHPHAK
ncbi:hypothetical protein B0H14DRAFT_2559055 [Mycena olivaceomarginata]|nr:hypothetical protein B0H14DRAFT_2559055 [Mycena olivaceomarginata]